MDRKGHLYLDPTEPALGKLTRDGVREQELHEEVADRLSWIEGVRVFVEVGDRRQGRAAQEQRAAAPPEGGIEPIASVAVNQPADLGPPESPVAPAVVEEPERGRVLVYVPRSFYFNRMLPRPDHREPTVEELHDAAGRIKLQVEEAIRPLLPLTWMLKVATIPDELPATRPASLAGGSDRRRSAADWGIVGAVAAAVALLMAMGSWIQAARGRGCRRRRCRVGIARIPPRTPGRRIGSASWSVATRRQRPASSSAGPPRGARPHERDRERTRQRPDRRRPAD